jgi:hypothetical protein
MKNLTLLTILFASMSLVSFTVLTPNNLDTTEVIVSDYCEGWSDGYCEGWKDVKGEYALCPLTPLCPLAEFGKSEYKHGYHRAFKAGSKAAR